MTFISKDGGIWQDLPPREPDWDALRAGLAEMTEADRLEAARRYCLARYAGVTSPTAWLAGYGPYEPEGDTPATAEQPDPEPGRP